MRLKTLEVQGYKSFANKSIFQFDEGITAVVGPNGSGKSNVSDAIRWVLGEQSYSSLRGQRTADMIFAGSGNRSKMGMASVNIILDNSDGSLPLDFNEVTISRRAYRSGENEYLINNNKVRLKDVAEILARGGLARQTYTSIGQGTIDRALSLRAEERRQLFEEAAGTTYHHQRRIATLKKLDETHANLLRVNDIVKEIEPRLKRLERQAEKVERHSIISLHLKGLLKVWYGYQWQRQQEALHLAKLSADASTLRMTEHQQRVEELSTHIKNLRQRQSDIRENLGGWYTESRQLHRQAENLQRELAVGEERAKQLAAQREEFITEIHLLEEQIQVQQSLVNQARQSLDEITQNYQDAQNTLKKAQGNLNTHQQERNALLHQEKQMRQKLERAAHAITDKQSRLQQLSERQIELQKQKDAQRAKIEQLSARYAESNASLESARKRLAKLNEKRAELENKVQKTRLALENLQEQSQNLNAQVSEKEKTLASLQARQDLLGKLRGDMSGYFSGVKAILQNKSLSGVRGTVAQLMQVPADLETALEMALGGKLQDLVVDSWHDAEKAIAYLKKTRAGRATFIPLDRIRPQKAVKVPKTEGMLGLATNLVSFDAKNKAAFESILNRLLIAADLPAARKAFDKLDGGFQIATRSGEITRSGGSITGGETRSKQQGGILGREREWRELPKQIAGVTADIDSLKNKLSDNAAEQKTLRTNLSGLLEDISVLTRDSSAIEKTIAQHEKTLSDLENQLQWQKELRDKSNLELENNQSREKMLKSEIETLTADKSTLQTEIAELANKITQLSAENLQAELSDARSQMALIQEKQQNQQALLRTHTQSLNQLQTQREGRQSRISALANQREVLLTRLETQNQEHASLIAAAETYTEKISPAETLLSELEKKQLAQEKIETKQRDHLRQAENDNHQHTLELARRQDDISLLQRQIEDDFGLVQFNLTQEQVGQPVFPLQSVVTDLPVIESVPDGIEEDIRRLKVQLRQLGNINFDAQNEYQELQARYDFLSTQMTDLENASADLKEVINELDRIIEESFTRTFETVAREFQNYFKILFGGGEAQLNLTDPEDITHTGIEIIARPPGKRSQNLDLLSGGERSLTAQALIFALLKTSPTPYCVFDEVDAMLDEANVDRFRKALFDLSKDIQFIIITHNRKTIEIADTVYGISMGNDAVSRVVSLKLEEAPKLFEESLS